jgi:hypothetical protein
VADWRLAATQQVEQFTCKWEKRMLARFFLFSFFFFHFWAFHFSAA